MEMYVHDAAFSHGGDTEDPEIVSTSRGNHVILPKSVSSAERSRVGRLFDQLFGYISGVNEWARAFVCASEEMELMDREDVEQTVLVLQGRRSAEEQRKEQQDMAARRRDGALQATARSPFAAAAGDHGRLRGMPEMCVLCPRHLAADEQHKMIVNYRNGGLSDFPIDHRLFDALYHVVLHPTGYVGWEHGIPLRTKAVAFASLPGASQTGSGPRGSAAYTPRETLSMCDYYAYRLHYRRGAGRTDNCMFMTSRLFQEYACVAFWRIETGRLNIHRMNQENMRQARQEELQHFAQQHADGQTPGEIGRVSYIPESFVGGPADMYQKYQDAMASVLHHGAPSLFVTFTANPKWVEIQQSLSHGQDAHERPDVIVRVFHEKLALLLDDLKEKLGHSQCCVHVIEFQKRGLPHAHIVVILSAADRPRTSFQVDQLTSSELPPQPRDDDLSPEADVQRRLRALVLEHMVHNDCRGRTNCPCWDASKQRCGGQFPFAFTNETILGDERRKTLYRRRNGEQWTHVNGEGRRISNEWIVPYNAELLLKYQCHLNVEVVTADYAIKYLFKYLFKGSDSASAAIKATERIIDRIGHYQAHRYLGSAEAIWRLYKLHMTSHTDTVVRMAVQMWQDQ